MNKTNDNKKIGDKVTIVVKTFERPDLIERCLKSIRHEYPSVPVIIADDSKHPVSYDKDPLTTVLVLPHDSGISYGRNRALERVITPYYVLIDDDHCFENDSNLPGLVSLLESTELDIVAMRMIDYRAGKDYARGELVFAGTMEIRGGVLRHEVGENRGQLAGYPLYDLVLNCYMAKRTSTSALQFDEKIKIGKEHGDYFLKAMDEKLKITVSVDSYIHHKPLYSPKYMVYRNRSSDFEKIFFAKYGLVREETSGVHYKITNRTKYYLSRLSYYLGWKCKKT